MAEYCDFVAATYDKVVDAMAPYAYRKQGAFDKVSFSEETVILPLGPTGWSSTATSMVAVIPERAAGNDGLDAHLQVLS